ncbi:MAG: succinate--CoA ligase subunit alpha, partial [Gammaproteobacteria bacterium]|nr:succinate--CoA ligase subunit alpha [Gammaproteobacteria bacterium]
EETAEFLKSAKSKKPVAAHIAGRYAPTDRRMGHAGTMNVFGKGGAQQKIDALQDIGVHVALSPADIGTTVRRMLDR